MKNLLFDDFRQWRVCLWSGVCKAAWGLLRILTCIIFGVVSIIASERTHRVAAEMQRDSISYELSRYTDK